MSEKINVQTNVQTLVAAVENRIRLESELDALRAENEWLRSGWLRVIQMENSCPATGGGCLAKRCGCVEEMEMLVNEAAPDPEVRPVWPPAGCIRIDSCERNGECMYLGCVNQGKKATPEVKP